MTHPNARDLVLAAERAIDTLDEVVSQRLGAARKAIADLDRAYEAKANEVVLLQQELAPKLAGLNVDIVDPEPALPVEPGSHIVVTHTYPMEALHAEAVLTGQLWVRVDGERWPNEDMGLPGWMITNWEPLQRDLDAT